MNETYVQLKNVEANAYSIIQADTYKVMKAITRFVTFILLSLGNLVGFILMQTVSFVINCILIVKGSWHTNFQSDGKHVK